MLAAIRKEFAMKRWILAGLAGAGLALAFGCDDSSADSAAIVVDSSQNGGAIALATGATFAVELAGNPTTGYEWTVAQVDAASLRLAEATYAADSSAAGAGGTYVFRFETLRPGTSTLGLVYRRAWETTAADQTFVLTVNVQGGADDDAAPGAASLADTRWRLAAWSASARAPAEFEITAEFAAGRIGGRSAVNSYGGDCSATADGDFSVGALAMTEMAGEPAAMQAESLYLSLLAQARRWRIANAQLVLSADAQNLLIFAPR